MTYDCFTFNGEMDMLEIRFNILDPYVDKFLICESTHTFSGKKKPIYYGLTHPKAYLALAPNIDTDSAFERAGHQKDFLRHTLSELGLDEEDIVYFGDVDEIWTPQEIKDDKVYNLRQLNYSYYLNNRSSEEWVGTIVGKWGTIKEHTLNYWRANHSHILDNGGWHFQNLNGADAIRKKLESYDHQEFNDEETKSLIEERMEKGEDYVGRSVDWKGRPFEFWQDESQLPKYLLDNREKYAHLFR